MNNFYNARINCGYTQKEVADLLEISRQAYGSYETEIRQPDPSTLIKLAKVFDTTVDYLLGVDNNLHQNNTALLKEAESKEKNILNNLASQLKKARNHSGIKVAEIASRLGVSQQTYYNYESGTREPSVENLRAIAKIYNVSVDYLLDLDIELSPINITPKEKAEIEEAAIIGERIKTLRKSNNLTQTEFGKLFGIGKTTVSSYETGNSCPNDSIKLAICRFFNVTTDYLLGNSNEKTPSSVTEEDVKAALFNGSKDVTPEMWEEVKDFAKYVQFKYGK